MTDRMSKEKDTEMKKAARSDNAAEQEKIGPNHEADPVGDAVEQEAAETEELSEEQKLQCRVDELEDRLLRTMADFDNYKKRVANRYEDLVRSANELLIRELLEVIDNLERALQHANDSTDADAMFQGTEMIFNQMKDFLDKHDVKAIEAIGKPFDPNYHEALMQVESDEYDEGIVTMEVKKGYTIGGRVLRHSKVGVSKGKTGQEDAEEADGPEEE